MSVYRMEFFAREGPGKKRMKPLWLASMTQGRCSGELYGGMWEDVGTPERLAALNA
jgi:MurNAc alpha-1-phosphate uridylyltransferase